MIIKFRFLGKVEQGMEQMKLEMWAQVKNYDKSYTINSLAFETIEYYTNLEGITTI